MERSNGSITLPPHSTPHRGVSQGQNESNQKWSAFRLSAQHRWQPTRAFEVLSPTFFRTKLIGRPTTPSLAEETLRYP
jgi:hypothetical protein